MTPVLTHHGSGPIVLGLPHAGTFVPAQIMGSLNQTGQRLADTDWHVHRLYDQLIPGLSTVRATFHRYVIDANREPTGASLYPGQNTTGLIPQTDFDGKNIWKTPPSGSETEQRRKTYHEPYHAALKDQIERTRDAHGVAILFDCHSIRSQIPFLFPGTLPDLNVGTNHGETCHPDIEATTMSACSSAKNYTSVLNGRFRGGWSTRHYGQPEIGVHAIQLELAQSTYLSSQAPPWNYDENCAAELRKLLKEILTDLANLATTLRGKP